MLDFIKAREFVRKLGLKSANEWKKYHLSNRPKDIPFNPNRSYKDWISWYDWLGKSTDNRKYVVNDDFFKVESRNSYYILGLWYADGFLNEKNNNISLTQHADDKYILDRILKEMSSNYPIRKHYNSNFYFSITSKEIVKDIKKLGGHQGKSMTIDFPKIPKEYRPDFIRGFFDGDGCITYQKNEKCYVSSFVSGSKVFIDKLIDFLRSDIDGFRGNISKSKNVYILSIGVNDTRRLGKYIYSNVNDSLIFLKRKHDKFINSGDIKIASFNKKFMSYSDAKEYIKNRGILKYRDWREYKKNNIVDIPSNMEFYSDYTGWKKFIE